LESTVIDRCLYDFLVIDFIEIAIKNQEIYCPHEGIDRRSEFE
jgi:hypothetical protein